jgi:hypothetical protein
MQVPSMTFGRIIAFVASAQQIFVDEFGASDQLTILFAVCAFAMGCAALANSRQVERLGTRLISQSAVLTLVGLSVLHIAAIASDVETLWTYLLFSGA